MVVDANVETGGGCDQPACRLAIRVAGRRITGRVIVDDHQRSRPDLERSPQNRPRMQGN